MSKFRIRLVVGDWGHDGHGMTHAINIHSDVPADELKEAYRKGVAIVGVDLTNDVACGYQDSMLRADVLAKLRAAGFNGLSENPDGDSDQDGENRGAVYLDWDEFAELWLFIARKGNPDLHVGIARKEPTINIGGYGLFS